MKQPRTKGRKKGQIYNGANKPNLVTSSGVLVSFNGEQVYLGENIS